MTNGQTVTSYKYSFHKKLGIRLAINYSVDAY